MTAAPLSVPSKRRFQRVAVLKGGWSSERSVSLVSGGAMAAAARRAGYDVTEIDVTRALYNQLVAADPEVALNGLHGPWGEDGAVQGVLELFGRPYSHSGVLASALAMDKAKARMVFAANGLDIAEGKVVPTHEAAKEHPYPPPYVVKPIAEGSSFGVLIVHKGANTPPRELSDPAWNFGANVLVEQFIPGRELTVGVIGEEALAVTEIIALRPFYDFDAKYAEGGSRHIVPADLPPEVTAKAMRDAVTAHRVLGCKGVSRSDFRYDPETGRVVILETNNQPGMTPTSLVPEQAAYRGLSFEDLVTLMIEDATCPR
jgi:D-alanine-D-alanine ligase